MVSGRNPKGIPILSSPYWWYNPISPSKLILNSCVQCKCGNSRGSCGGYMAAQRFQYYKPVRINNEDIFYLQFLQWSLVLRDRYLHPLIEFKLSSLKIHYCHFCYFTVSSKKMEIKRTVEKRRLSISFEEFESYKTPLTEEFLQLGVSI